MADYTALDFGSGWLCYPGKLKRRCLVRSWAGSCTFRMALLSGEVETRSWARSTPPRWRVPDGFAIRGS